MWRVGTAENKGGRNTSAQVILLVSNRLSFYFLTARRGGGGETDRRTDILSRRGDGKTGRSLGSSLERHARRQAETQPVNELRGILSVHHRTDRGAAICAGEREGEVRTDDRMHTRLETKGRKQRTWC